MRNELNGTRRVDGAFRFRFEYVAQVCPLTLANNVFGVLVNVCTRPCFVAIILSRELLFPRTMYSISTICNYNKVSRAC